MIVSTRRLLIGLGILLTACSTQAPPQAQFVVTPEAGAPAFQRPSAGYPATSGATAVTSGYPGPAATASGSKDGRSVSALASLKIAEQVAKKEYDPNVVLYGIVPSEIMIGNLGGPPVLPGWFYEFRVAGAKRQFIVQVADGAVTGTTTAEAIEEPGPAKQPIDVTKVKVDSPQVFEQFKQAKANGGADLDTVIYDLELINLAGKGGPVWSVVDPRTKSWLYSIKAETGQEVPDPHK